MPAAFSAAAFFLVSVVAQPSLPASDAAQLIGTWRGTSICVDRAAAPACRDERVVYEFTPGSKPGVVHWAADKIVDGERVPMGAFDLTYDAAEKCWKGEVQAGVHSVWRLNVTGASLSGTGRVVPGNQVIRQISAHSEAREQRMQARGAKR